jgi:histidinol-phosphate aminotransferase
MPPEPRRPVAELPSVVHGALDFEELQRLGFHPDEILDFSANINPYGPSPAVRAALADVPLDRYPDRQALAFRAILAESIGVPPGRILAGNGASELIALTALAFVRPGDAVLVIGPTYGEYARTIGLMGGRVVTWRARTEDDFALDPDKVGREVERLEPRLVFLCRPNNPTGIVFPAVSLSALARRHPATLFVVDEAYQPFASDQGSALDDAAENVLILRSMTKDFGLAGVRLGYAVGSEPLIEALRRGQPPWSVSALAQAAGVAALGDPAHRARSLEQLDLAKMALTAGLTRLGLNPLPSVTPFFLVPVGDGAAFRKVLLTRRILVRDCASFGLPTFVRISTRRPGENERLLAAIREVR